MKRILLLGLAWICVALGFTGVIIPVLPTTPFLLLAVFLFSRYSPRTKAWLESTKIHAKYVEPFKSAGGLPMSTKVRILVISYTVLAISAYFARKPVVWVILGLCVIFLAYLMFIRIPTISKEEAEAAEEEAEREYEQSLAAEERAFSED